MIEKFESNFHLSDVLAKSMVIHQRGERESILPYEELLMPKTKTSNCLTLDEAKKWLELQKKAFLKGHFYASLNLMLICGTKEKFFVRQADLKDAETIAEIVNPAYAKYESFFIEGDRTSATNVQVYERNNSLY